MSARVLPDLLAASARRSPERLAVIAEAHVLTYRQLHELSCRLASAFRQNGICAGHRVGIYVDKSVEAVIAIFGILQAGAAYVPLDPRMPARRASAIIEGCDMRGLVTTRDRLENLKPLLKDTPACLVVLDAEGSPDAASFSALLQTPTDAADAAIGSDSLAYILYTSGSTGEPKGVMISHHAALSFINWAADYFSLGPEDRLASHAPLHFDLSIFDVFGAVAAGATVSLVPASVGIFPRNLADWIERDRITVWYSVPSALTQLVLHGGLERHSFSSLRLVLFAGEVFPVRQLRALMEHIPHAAYYNLYGPTETNVCTVHHVQTPPAAEGDPVPIGRACAGAEVFALDEDGRRPEAGGMGELYVRGPTLMEGYWGRPEDTRERLIPDPLNPGSSERVYRTGDIVRVGESGEFHFVGRRDAQVKSRGYRIEPGEVEAALCRHPAVAECAVIPAAHAEFGCTLRAVIVPAHSNTPTRHELAALCAEYLPPYMIPAEFEFRAALPRTSSGKVDRSTLAQAIGAHSEARGSK